MIGSTLGPYRLVAELGAGGMGKVFRAEGPDGVVALKVVHPHLLETPHFFERFRREADVGRRVRHENVVATIGAGEAEAGGRPQRFLVMEYVEGQTLRRLLDELGRVPEALCRHVGREIAKGLAAIHAAGVVHRDVKPENVLVTADQTVKVMDLGVARLVDESVRLSQSGAFVGSVEYAAPEQFRSGGDVDGRADLHSLGAVLYELATGLHPFRGDDFRQVMRKVLDEKPRRAGEVHPQLSPFFEELLAELLEKDRAARPRDAALVAEILEQGEESEWWRGRAQALREKTKRPLRRVRIPRETALHGRDAEIAKLRGLYEAARAGDGRVVLVEGEAGIGKSRLVDEFVGRLASEGEDVNFLHGSYPPGGAATASGAFATAFREQFGDAGAGAWLQQAPLLVPAFDALLRGEAPPADAVQLTRDSLQTAFVHVVRGLAAERPTILLIDDLHFAPEEGRALFAALALAVAGRRVLLVGTARPGLDERWVGQLATLGTSTADGTGARALLARMTLPRLRPKDVANLLLDALKSERTAEEVAYKVILKSDGNPFFVFEILRGLREGRFLARTPTGTWVTTGVIAEIEIPSTILDLVNARVAGLAAEDRELLELASCLGFEFDPLLLGEVAEIGRIPLLKRLGRIEREHRLVRAAGPRFLFDHHQVQEALYGGLSDLLRREYHSALAARIEVRTGAAGRDAKDLDGALCVDLAEHHLKGSDASPADRYLDSALTYLSRSGRLDAAMRLSTTALEAPGMLSPPRRCEVLFRRSSVFQSLGRRADEQRDLAESLGLADASGDPKLAVRARAGTGWLFARIGRHEDAEKLHREAVALAQSVGFREGEARATTNLGIHAQMLGRLEEARELLTRSLGICREIGFRTGEALAAGNLGLVFDKLGDDANALSHHQMQIAICRELGDRLGEVVAGGNIAVNLQRAGRMDAALPLCERFLEDSRQVGMRRVEAVATGNLANLLDDLGRLADARALHERHLALACELGLNGYEATAVGTCGASLRYVGRHEEARVLHERSRDLSRTIGQERTEGIAETNLGSIEHEFGRYEAARAHHERAGEIARRCGDDEGVVFSLGDIGAALVDEGRIDEAAAKFDEAIAAGRDLRGPSRLVLCTAERARLPGGDPTRAAALLEELASRTTLLDRMRARFLLWQATRDGAHLAESKRLLAFLVEHAPAEDRAAMVGRVRLYREIAEALA